MRTPPLPRVVVMVTVLLGGSPALGQSLPAGPFTALNGRLAISGDVSASGGPKDDGYFNFTDYDYSALRLFRIGISGAWRPIVPLSFVAELRSENLENAELYAAFVRFAPWRGHPFSIQAGRIPPSFGAFGRRTYSSSNALIGYPLAYQYLSSLRPDAIPAAPDDLLRMRGRGWEPRFPIGSTATAGGSPLVSAFRWDTGVQATWDGPMVGISAALTNGTLSDPRTSDNNAGKQVSGRVALRPTTGLVLGASASRGGWLASDVERLLPQPLDSDPHPQTAYGADAEYSRDHWIVQAEVVHSTWTLPFSRPVPTETNLRALGAWVEGRYRLTPRIFVGGRLDHLGFSQITGSAGRPTAWDAPVTRIEWGGGYYLQRNVIARAVVQHNRRDGGRVRHRTFVAVQLAYWF